MALKYKLSVLAVVISLAAAVLIITNQDQSPTDAVDTGRIELEEAAGTEQEFSPANDPYQAYLEAIEKYIPEMNIEYSALREHQGVKKRGLVIDSPEARKFLRSYKDSKTTKIKLISAKEKTPPFQTTMQIYDNKVSYVTLTDEYFVGIIITDQNIANTHKYLFESLWRLSSGAVVI